MSRVVVLLSGGLDSTVCMAACAAAGDTAVPVIFDYGQRHIVELASARRVADHYGVQPLLVHIDASQWGGSALTDPAIDIPLDSLDTGTPTTPPPIPITYVPARNIIFLSIGLGIAEARDAEAVTIGVNALDYSGYPDCRPEFMEAFRRVAAVGQKRGVEGHPVEIRTPLIDLTKAEIIRMGVHLEAPLHMSWSCYTGDAAPCGHCDACLIRARGFADAKVADPALVVR